LVEIIGANYGLYLEYCKGKKLIVKDEVSVFRFIWKCLDYNFNISHFLLPKGT